MTDNVNRRGVRQVALLALTAKEFEDLKLIVDSDPRHKNYAVVLRKLIAKEAKAIREGLF